MYSSEDFEKLWFLYKLEGQSKNISIESFCLQQGVSYTAFPTGFPVARKELFLWRLLACLPFMLWKSPMYYVNLKLHAQLSQQGVHLKSMQFELKKSLRESAKYRALYEVLRNEKFVGTSQKSVKSRPEAGCDDDKGDWDGTANANAKSSISETGSAAASEAVGDCPAQSSSDSTQIDSVGEPKKAERPYRKGYLFLSCV